MTRVPASALRAGDVTPWYVVESVDADGGTVRATVRWHEQGDRSERAWSNPATLVPVAREAAS